MGRELIYRCERDSSFSSTPVDFNPPRKGAVAIRIWKTKLTRYKTHQANGSETEVELRRKPEAIKGALDLYYMVSFRWGSPILIPRAKNSHKRTKPHPARRQRRDDLCVKSMFIWYGWLNLDRKYPQWRSQDTHGFEMGIGNRSEDQSGGYIFRFRKPILELEFSLDDYAMPAR